HGVQPAWQALRQLLREHAGQRRVVDLHTVDEVRLERGPQDVAHVRVVVTQTCEALAGMEIEISATRGVVEVRPLGRRVLLVEAEDPQHVDERWIEMARGQFQGLAGARRGLWHHAQRIRGMRVGAHKDHPQTTAGQYPRHGYRGSEWAVPGSNGRPPACKAGALTN